MELVFSTVVVPALANNEIHCSLFGYFDNFQFNLDLNCFRDLAVLCKIIPPLWTHQSVSLSPGWAGVLTPESTPLWRRIRDTMLLVWNNTNTNFMPQCHHQSCSCLTPSLTVSNSYFSDRKMIWNKHNCSLLTQAQSVCTTWGFLISGSFSLCSLRFNDSDQRSVDQI